MGCLAAATRGWQTLKRSILFCAVFSRGRSHFRQVPLPASAGLRGRSRTHSRREKIHLRIPAVRCLACVARYVVLLQRTPSAGRMTWDIGPRRTVLTNTTWQSKRPPGTLPATFVLYGGPHGTIFATFSCHHRQKCSVSCNNSNRSQCKPGGGFLATFIANLRGTKLLWHVYRSAAHAQARVLESALVPQRRTRIMRTVPPVQSRFSHRCLIIIAPAALFVSTYVNILE